MSPLLDIRMIPAEDTYPIRQVVLRPGRDPEECVFPGDEERSSLHLGIFSDQRLVGVASFMKNGHPEFRNDIQYQLRGMAILPEYRGKQLGAYLLQQGENKLLDRHKEVLLWFNAREQAVDFYRKFGYKTYGVPFMIPTVCMHQVMFKEIP